MSCSNSVNYKSPIDIFLSHDWPQGIWKYGDESYLLRCKPFFREDMQSGQLGSPPLMMLLKNLAPRYVQLLFVPLILANSYYICNMYI